MTKVYLVVEEAYVDPCSDETSISVIAAFATSQAANEHANELRNQARKHNWRYILGFDVEEVQFENR